MDETLLPADARVLVVGAGLMGAGIAQVAAQAGHPVHLFDAREGAAEAAVAQVARALDALVAKGRLAPEDASAAIRRLAPVRMLEEAAGAALAIEAIVEREEPKRELLQRLEALLGEDAVLASNTSSISITALARGLARPQRLVGMHFFNPVPRMRLVEVVSGLRTAPAVARAVEALARRWGKTPVHAASTPGFIVNRIARPFYAEALALLQERAAEPAAVDACLRAAGFRMGPCELMDLIGHDTNFAVTCSVFESNFGDRRFGPSLVQRALVDGGLLGRKAGGGFYAGSDGPADDAVPGAWQDGGGGARAPGASRVTLHGRGAFVDRWAAALTARGILFARESASGWTGLEADGGTLRLTDGRPATRVAAEEGRRDVALFDLPLADAPPQGAALAWTVARTASPAWVDAAPRWLALAGVTPVRVEDAAGLVVARTVAMLVNEACDAVQQGVCTPEAADLAMTLGVNYPDGPFAWLARVGAGPIATLLDHLDTHYRGERYRVSPELRQRAWAASLDEARDRDHALERALDLDRARIDATT